MAKKRGKESTITGGRVNTDVEAFLQSDPFGTPPFSPTYGDHKAMGSEMAPMVTGGRGAKESMRKTLNTGGRGGPK